MPLPWMTLPAMRSSRVSAAGPSSVERLKTPIGQSVISLSAIVMALPRSIQTQAPNCSYDRAVPAASRKP